MVSTPGDEVALAQLVSRAGENGRNFLTFCEEGITEILPKGGQKYSSTFDNCHLNHICYTKHPWTKYPEFADRGKA